MKAQILAIFVLAIRNLATDEARVEILEWLAEVRELLSRRNLTLAEQFIAVSKLINYRKLLRVALQSVEEAAKTLVTNAGHDERHPNSKRPDSEILGNLTHGHVFSRFAVPAALAALGLAGGGKTLAATLGTSLGLPALLVIALGPQGITQVLEQFIGTSAARGYVATVSALTAEDRLFQRLPEKLRLALTTQIEAPERHFQHLDEIEIRESLAWLKPPLLRKQVMWLFQSAGLLSWVTRDTATLGFSGCARHPNGIILVACSHHIPNMEEEELALMRLWESVKLASAWRGYLITTGSYSRSLRRKCDDLTKLGSQPEIVLMENEDLVSAHLRGLDLRPQSSRIPRKGSRFNFHLPLTPPRA